MLIIILRQYFIELYNKHSHSLYLPLSQKLTYPHQHTFSFIHFCLFIRPTLSLSLSNTFILILFVFFYVSFCHFYLSVLSSHFLWRSLFICLSLSLSLLKCICYISYFSLFLSLLYICWIRLSDMEALQQQKRRGHIYKPQ